MLEDCGIVYPPTPTDVVLDYLGLPMREIDYAEFPDPGMSEVKQKAPSMLLTLGERATIFVDKDMGEGRKRLSVFHECGHAHIPWHRGRTYYRCKEVNRDSDSVDYLERQAYEYAAELLMPRGMFYKAMVDFPIALDASRELSRLFVASFEATAIRYAKFHPGICCLVKCEPVPAEEEGSNHYSLRVTYCVPSHRFPKYWRPGTLIANSIGEYCSPILYAHTSGQSVCDEIPASVFGSRSGGRLKAECKPIGVGGHVFTLLWMPDRQLTVL